MTTTKTNLPLLNTIFNTIKRGLLKIGWLLIFGLGLSLTAYSQANKTTTHQHSHQAHKHESGTQSPVHQFYCGEAAKVWPGWDGNTYTYEVSLLEVHTENSNVDIGEEEIYVKFIVNDQWQFVKNGTEFFPTNNGDNLDVAFDPPYTTIKTINEYEPLIIMLAACEVDGAVGNTGFNDENLGKVYISVYSHNQWNNFTESAYHIDFQNTHNSITNFTNNGTNNVALVNIRSVNVGNTTRNTTFIIKIEQVNSTSGIHSPAQLEINQYIGTRIVYDNIDTGSPAAFYDTDEDFIMNYTGKNPVIFNKGVVDETNPIISQNDNVYFFNGTYPFSSYDTNLDVSNENTKALILGGNNSIPEGVTEEDNYNPSYQPRAIWERMYGGRDEIVTDYEGDGGAFFKENNALRDAKLFRDHFWDPDSYNDGYFNIGGNGFFIISDQINGGSAQQKAQMYWDFYAIPQYMLGRLYSNPNFIDSSYYNLGRVLHHLQDMSSIPHTQRDGHPPGNTDTYEYTIGKEFVTGTPGNNYNFDSLRTFNEKRNAGNPTPLWSYEEFKPKCLDHNNIAKYVDGTNYFYTPDVLSTIPLIPFHDKNALWEWKNFSNWGLTSIQLDSLWHTKTPLFHLLYSMAETTDNYPSDEADGDFILNTEPPWLEFSDNWRLAGNDIMPKLLSHTAGLYRLFWASTHYPMAIDFNGEYTNFMEYDPGLIFIAEKMTAAYIETFNNSGKYDPGDYSVGVNHIGSPMGDCLVKPYQSGNYYRTYNHGGLFYNQQCDEVFVIGKYIWNEWLYLKDDPSTSFGAPLSSQIYLNDSYVVLFENGIIEWKGDQSSAYYDFELFPNSISTQYFNTGGERISKTCKDPFTTNLNLNGITDDFTVYWAKDNIFVGKGNPFSATEEGYYTAYIGFSDDDLANLTPCKYASVGDPIFVDSSCLCNETITPPVISEPTNTELCEIGSAGTVQQIILEISTISSGSIYNWFIESNPTPIGTGPEIAITIPGNYYATTTDGLCTSNSSNIVSVTDENCIECDPLLTTPSLTANAETNICLTNTGSPQQVILIANAILPTNYQFTWYKNGIRIEDNLSGELIIYPESYTGSGTYQVRLEGLNETAACNSSFSNAITVTVSNCDSNCSDAVTPSIVTFDYVICARNTNNDNIPGSILLEAVGELPTDYTFQWYKDDEQLFSEQERAINISDYNYGLGNYTVKLINSFNGCTSALSNSIFISTVDCNNEEIESCANLPQLNITTNETNLCSTPEAGPTQTVLLDATTNLPLPKPPNGFYYQWQKDGNDVFGATAPSLTVNFNEIGEYAVYLTNGSGCTSDISNKIEITNNCTSENPCEEAVINSVNVIDDECISLNVTLDEDCCTGLTKEDFKVFQNGQEQIIYEVLYPGSGDGFRLVDIILVLDISSSMRGEITAVKNNLESFLTALEDEGDIDYAVGIMGFTDCVMPFNNSNLYFPNENNSPRFKEIFDTLSEMAENVSGGGDLPENQLGAMANASLYPLRPGSQRIMIMLTDDSAHEENSVTPWTVSTLIEQRLEPNEFIVYPIFDPRRGSNQFVPIAVQTNPPLGTVFSITENFNSIISEISNELTETYVITYCKDGFTNEFNNSITIEVNCGDYEFYSDNLIPQGSPEISITGETYNLTQEPGFQPYSPFLIRAIIEDASESIVNEVLLYYGTSNTILNNSRVVSSLPTEYSFTAMVHKGNNIWEGIIPPEAAEYPGIDFYIKASNGVGSVTDPASDPTNFPYQIAIFDNEKPAINHSRIFEAIVGEEIQVYAEISDDTDSLETVQLYYRVIPGPGYINIDMTNISGNLYCATIPSDKITCAGIDYYIYAVDNKEVASTNGSAGNPNTFYPVLSATPNALTAKVISENEISLNWIDNSAGTERFIIERTVTSNSEAPPKSSYRLIGENVSGNTSYVDEIIIEIGNVYWYRVRNENACEIGNGSYDSVTIDNICEVFGCGCTDTKACNTDENVTINDGSCEYESCKGCTNPKACNYNENATISDESICEYESCKGCTDQLACNWNPDASIADFSVCDYDCSEIAGCVDISACNYNPFATIEGDCSYEECEEVSGCTLVGACNYNPKANQNDESCEYESCKGCTDPSACNFNSSALIADQNCDYETCKGCSDITACNYNPVADINDGTCEYISCLGCVDLNACNYNESASISDGSCEYDSCKGCTDPSACNYNPEAKQANDLCDYETCAGCTDEIACNYNPSATISFNCDYESCKGCTDQSACNYNPNATISIDCEYNTCIGCTEPGACNYNAEATISDDACEFTTCSGCADLSACNYNPFASSFDVSLCEYVSCEGCTDSNACNYSPSSKIDNGNCDYTSCLGCTDKSACNFDPNSKLNDGSCEYTSCLGCADPGACNYNPLALVSDQTCNYASCLGCLDPVACNFDPTALINDSNCEYVSCTLPNTVGCTDISACNFNVNATENDGSCENESCNPVFGCTDPTACNFNSLATRNIGSCEYISCTGCTDALACNYNSTAKINDNSCDYSSCKGCTDPSACNYDIDFTISDLSVCEYDCAGCLDPKACNFNQSATSENGSCEYVSCVGCTDRLACNFNPNAKVENGSCEYISCLGCTDIKACNFNPDAKIHNGVCEYTSCSGCTDKTACNFNSKATLNDDSCEFASCSGCADFKACNFNPTAIINDNSCEYSSCVGCIDLSACNFNPTAKIDNGTCEYETCKGCTNPNACNYNIDAKLPDNSCEYLTCEGCTDPLACNYDSSAKIHSLTCEYESCDNKGCTDPNACNFNSAALYNDGNCDYSSCMGCTDASACNYNPTALFNDPAICNYSSCSGCTDQSACNYDPLSIINDGSCEYISCGNLAGCTDEDACNFNIFASINDNTCEYASCGGRLEGCTDSCAPNYNPSATDEDGSCEEYKKDCNSNCLNGDLELWDIITCRCVTYQITVLGCTDNKSCNFNPSANCDDLSCTNNCDPCNSIDYLALKVLYQSTDGDNWFRNDGWEQVTGDNPPANCNLSDLFGVQLDNYGRVTQINLYNNDLKGTLPPEIGDLSELTALYLSSVSLNGEIPIEIANLRKLKNLFFVASGISGTIPKELGQLRNLKDLRLSDNQLSGEIPIELTTLPNLNYLSLDDNQISGSIPPELANLSKLRWLSLSNNQLTGSIPAELSTLTRLQLLILSHNDLSGCYPTALGTLCDQLTYNFFEEEEENYDDISLENRFDESWGDFCDTGAGDCNTLRLGDLNNFYLHPNPTTGNVFVQFENSVERPRNINIYDVTGKSYLSKIFKNSAEVELPTQDFPKGIYIVVVNNSFNSKTQKLIIQ